MWPTAVVAFLLESSQSRIEKKIDALDKTTERLHNENIDNESTREMQKNEMRGNHGEITGYRDKVEGMLTVSDCE